MYKKKKITKRVEIAINRFSKSSKTISPVYKTGFHKWHDDINSFSTYSLVIGRYRVLIYVNDSNPVGHCQG